jgi:hypothetical protein
MSNQQVTLSVSEEMYHIISTALLNHLLECEKIADHVGGSFAIDNAVSAALMFHSFTSAFD